MTSASPPRAILLALAALVIHSMGSVGPPDGGAGDALRR